MKKKYAEEIKAYNIAYKAKDHALWEIKNGLRQVNLVRNPGGWKPKWKYSKKTSQQTREGKGRIDWKRYCKEILILRFIPFMHRLCKEFPNTKHVV